LDVAARHAKLDHIVNAHRAPADADADGVGDERNDVWAVRAPVLGEETRRVQRFPARL